MTDMIVLDRFEEDLAILETDNGMISVLRSDLPDDVKCGDVLEYNNGVYSVSQQKTVSRHKSLFERFRQLRQK